MRDQKPNVLTVVTCMRLPNAKGIKHFVKVDPGMTREYIKSKIR